MGNKRPADGSVKASDSLTLADILVPYLGVQLNVPGKHLDALTGIEVDDVDAALSQPFDPAGKIPRLAHDYCPDLELPDQTAAIPARRQRGYHDLVAVRRQPASLAKCIRLAMD